jgi:hypothetical protein
VRPPQGRQGNSSVTTSAVSVVKLTGVICIHKLCEVGSLDVMVIAMIGGFLDVCCIEVCDFVVFH